MVPLPSGTATKLLLIRTAMLLGVLLFGAVTWYLQRQGSLETIEAGQTRLLTYVFMALVATALATLFALRARLASARDAARQFTLYIAGYAVAEGAALFGGVIWFIGGAREWYIAGLVLMVVAFQILPVRR